MNRSAKVFRAISGFCLLTTIITFFLPLTVESQENYRDVCFTSFDYVSKMADGLGTKRVVIIVFLIILPVLVAAVAGMLGLVGSARQLVTSICSFVCCTCSFILLACMNGLYINTLFDTATYSRGIAIYIQCFMMLAATVFGILAIVKTPRLYKSEEVNKEDVVQEMKQELKSQYVVSEEVIQEEPVNIPTSPRGVMVGLAGPYQGAEIPLNPGETIKIGRANTNDLVFDDQMSISRNHCSITWLADKQKFCINDFSSCGSFLNGSTDCLPQNMDIWLSPGDIIGFGNDQNQFRLE